MFLPTNSTMDTVKTEEMVGRYVPRFWEPLCSHRETTSFTWIDHRAGPGSFADTFEGLVCKKCARIVKIHGINGTADPVQ